MGTTGAFHSFYACLSSSFRSGEHLMPLCHLQASLATDFMWNWNAREATASCGYDHFFRQSRLRGKFDTNGVVSAYLEEKINQTVNFLLSAEIDHYKKDYKFGFGMTIGE